MPVAKLKIDDPRLLAFATSEEESDSASVIIELHAPPGEFSPAPPSRDYFGSIGKLIKPRSFGSEKKSAQSRVLSLHRDELEQLEHDLKKIISRPLTRLESAEAFIADVSPDELREISDLPQVGLIRPNRTHHA